MKVLIGFKWLRIGPVVGFCEQGFHKSKEFLSEMSNCCFQGTAATTATASAVTLLLISSSSSSSSSSLLVSCLC
jgi:hypothetical protein